MKHKDYFDYLNNISVKGRLYRYYYLYPKLKKWVKGEVLDVGCGVGAFLKYNANGKGVDFNEHCVAICKTKGLDVVQMELDKLPFEDSKFDTIILDNVLEHILDVNPLLIECSRVLRKQGRIIVGVPTIKGFCSDRDHKNFFSEDRLINTLLQYSFFPLQHFYAPFNLLGKKFSAHCLYVVFERDDLI